MSVYKASILNKEINVNYEIDQKDKLIEAIKSINSKLQNSVNYNDYINGKVSDSKLLSLLVIELQADLIEANENKKNENNLEKKFKDSNTENINLNDKLYQLREQNVLLKKENDFMNEELKKIQNQIDIITSLVKNAYE
tara:strand:- start:196 stop:612 length:417 start_codon:yes stop_codon:yes gene_type:complete